jgi:hypothetical protein
MDRLGDSTDRFEDKFDSAMHARVANKTNRDEIFTRWTEDLEQVTDKLADEYRKMDAKGFSDALHNTFVIAAALNRVVLRSQLTPEVTAEWNSIRDELNTLAKVFGHAMLPGAIVSVKTKS